MQDFAEFWKISYYQISTRRAGKNLCYFSKKEKKGDNNLGIFLVVQCSFVGQVILVFSDLPFNKSREKKICIYGRKKGEICISGEGRNFGSPRTTILGSPRTKLAPTSWILIAPSEVPLASRPPSSAARESTLAVPLKMYDSRGRGVNV